MFATRKTGKIEYIFQRPLFTCVRIWVRFIIIYYHIRAWNALLCCVGAKTSELRGDNIVISTILRPTMCRIDRNLLEICVPSRFARHQRHQLSCTLMRVRWAAKLRRNDSQQIAIRNDQRSRVRCWWMRSEWPLIVHLSRKNDALGGATRTLIDSFPSDGIVFSPAISSFESTKWLNATEFDCIGKSLHKRANAQFGRPLCSRQEWPDSLFSRTQWTRYVEIGIIIFPFSSEKHAIILIN